MNNEEGDPWSFGIQAVAAVGLLFILSMITASAFGATAGSYADWLAAFSTLAAFAAALAAAWYASRAYAKEVRRDRERDQLSRREQANLIATWPGQVLVVPDFAMVAAPDSREIVQVAAIVRNASQVPITGVELVVQVNNYTDDSVKISTPLIRIAIPLVPPGIESKSVIKVLPKPVPIAQFGVENLAELESRLRVAMIFRDAANRRWTRDSEGRLGEVIESGDPPLKLG